MKLTRGLLLVAVLGLAGNLGATSSSEVKKVQLKPKTSLCIACTAYCKAHPNSPRCN